MDTGDESVHVSGEFPGYIACVALSESDRAQAHLDEDESTVVFFFYYR